MTDLLEKAIASIRTLPEAAQDDVAHMILSYVEADEGPVQLTPEEEADIAESEAEAERGAYASDADMRAIWTKYGA